jgi:hypothetical protein
MRFRLLLSGLCVFSAGAGIAFANNASKVPQYRVGDKAQADVVATIRVAAVDPEKTAALREKEAPRVPVIYRWNTNAIEEAVLELRDAFATNRQNFVVPLQKSFNRSVLEDRHLTNQRFSRAIHSFQSAHKSFPLSSNLAVAWARGEPDDEYIAPFEAYLRKAMNHYLRPDEHPPEAKIGWQVKLVPSDATSPLQPPAVQRTRGIARSNVIAIGKVRFEYRDETSPEPRAIGKYALSFLQPTCIADAALTREWRDREVGTLTSVNRYEPGDIIVRKGETITPATKAALDEFRGKLALIQGPTTGPALGSRPLTPWLIAGGATLLALVTALVLWLGFRRKTMALALVPESLGQETAAAVKNDPVIRARLTEHLTRLLGQSVVQRLLSQRGQLIKTQEAAVQQAEELGQRLEKVETDMQERFGAYEQRIVELEAELEAAEEQNRDLIRAKIAIAKEELERERAKARVDWN